MPRRANTNIKLSPKLVELCKSPLIDSVNAMLDAGESPNAVCKYICANGFKISPPLVYEYAKVRKQMIINNINIEHIIGVARTPIQVEKTPSFDTKRKKLKSEIDALDKLIGLGYDSIDVLYGSGKPLPVGIMMQAIQLKNSLTEGAHGFLTEYGMNQLREMEKQKYELIIDMIVSYVPEEMRQEVLDNIEETEDEYYRNTEYYEEYLRAKGLTDEEIVKRLDELEQLQKDQNIDGEDDDAVVIKV